MTPTVAHCHWCDHDRPIDPHGLFLRHRAGRAWCKGSERHKHTRPRKKKGSTTS